MKLIIISILFCLFSGGAFASSTRALEADTILSSDKTKTITMPTTSGTLPVIGSIPIAAQFNTDNFTANGVLTAFTLSNTPASNAQVQVYLNGILQSLTTDYTISGTTLTFVITPVIGQNIRVTYSRY